MLDFSSQQGCIQSLTKCSQQRAHSVLISGPVGSGKTFLASYYSKLLNIDDFVIVKSNIQEIRTSIQESVNIDNDLVVCIENLDYGVSEAAYTMLKFLEEPKPNVYIVVTARSIWDVPNTIVSRCVCCEVDNPSPNDIQIYSERVNFDSYMQRKDKLIWRCASNFSNANDILKLTDEQIKYFDNLFQNISSGLSISAMSWTLTHYPDNTQTPICLVIEYIMRNIDSASSAIACINCISDIQSGRVAQHAAVSRLLFELKYT